MIKTFLLSNDNEIQELLQLEDSDCVTLEVEVDTDTNEYRVYGNDFDLTSQEFLGEGVLSKKELEFISSF